jgi:gamma-D-glutamyl-L-lysine dipeptidyl-peptidase
MSDAICIVPVANIRLMPDHRAEMTSQLLFGEALKVHHLDKNGWAQAESLADGYKGYCRINQIMTVDKPVQERYEYAGEWVNEIMLNDAKLMIPFGSNLSVLHETIPGCSLSFNGNVYSAANAAISPEGIMKVAAVFLNTAYLWGGKSVFGIDCSGFVQSVFKMFKKVLPRDANSQVSEGEGIGFLAEARCGDLAFFDDENGEIIHVGILINDEQIIHSSGNVRIDRIDNEGIINSSTKKRTHHLRIIKRII